MMVEKSRIEWLSVLQGWSMLLVVIGHITLTNIFENPETPITAKIECIIYSFHMPLFMFISGFLFYYSKIERRKKYLETIKDKMKRLGVPFCFFTVFTLLIKYALNPLMKRPVELSLDQIINSFLYPSSNPLGELWFIGTLLVLFMFFPLFRWSLGNSWKVVLMGSVCLFLNLFFPFDIRLFCISKVAYFLIYFYAGVLFMKYKWYQKLDSIYLLPLFIICFFLSRFLFLTELVYTFSGIFASISLCMLLTRYVPSLFESFRNYTFQIFLLGIFWQMMIRLLYAKINIDILYFPFYILSILMALYIPVWISTIVRKIDNKYLKMCLGL